MCITENANSHTGPCFAVTPDTVMLCGNGRVKFTTSSFGDVKNPDFVPPEYVCGQCVSEVAAEKVNPKPEILVLVLICLYLHTFKNMVQNRYSFIKTLYKEYSKIFFSKN